MYLANTLVNVDSACRAALSLDKQTVALDATGNPGTGAANLTALTALTNGLTSGDVVRLPAGTILVDFGANAANYVTFTSGARFIGHAKGTVIKVTNPGSNHFPLRASSNLTLEDITFQWDSSSQPTGGGSGLFYGASLDKITVKRCVFVGPAASGSQLYYLYGVMPVTLFACTNVTFEQCEVKWSTGTLYGLNLIGGSNHFYDRCYFHDNAADGVKIQGNVTYGRASNIRFSDCRSDANGQVVMQGQTIATTTYTTTTTITPVNGARYRLNFGSAGSLTLNNGTNGDVILISKVIGSQDVAIKNQAGTTLFTMSSSNQVNSDRVVERLTFSGGAWFTEPSHDYYTNGEGWDITGENIVFTNCIATGNDGANFQVKPTEDQVAYNGSNACSDIRFVGCTAKGSVNGNGFGVVNAISGDYETAPQNISFSDCSAYENYQSGFVFTGATRIIDNVSMVNCRSRANGNSGCVLTGPVRNAKLHMCDFQGNGTIIASSWNLIIPGTKGTRVSHCTFSGVDDHKQGLLTEVAMDNAANAKCYGIYVDKVSGTYTMTDCVIDNCRFESHLSGLDLAFYTAGTGGDTGKNAFNASISSSRVALGANSAGVLTFMNQQTASGLGVGVNSVTFT